MNPKAILFVLATVAAAAACTPRVSQENVAKFSVALESATQSTAGAFSSVNETGREAELSRRSVSFAFCFVDDATLKKRRAFCKDYIETAPAQNLKEPKPLLSKEIIDDRTKTLEAVAQYAKGLSKLAGDQQRKRAEAAFKAAGASFGDLFAKGGADPKRLNILVDILGKLAGYMVQDLANKALDDAIIGADPLINELADKLTEDLTNLEKLALLDLNEILRESQAVLLDDEAKKLTAAERQAAYLSWSENLGRQEVAARAFGRTRSLVARMQAAHQALLEPESVDASVKVEAFFKEASEIAEILKKLNG